MHEGFNQHLAHSDALCVCCHYYLTSLRLLCGVKVREGRVEMGRLVRMILQYSKGK